MEILQTKLSGVLVFQPKVFCDDRGWFLETWSRQQYEKAGIAEKFVQDNVSFSTKGILRGLHFQHPNSQGKLLQVLSGEVFDVAVDIRIGSQTFGQWVSQIISGENHKQMYILRGFAHGFCVLSETAIFSYKCTDYYSQSTEGGIIWNDSQIAIDWPISEPILSAKDSRYPQLKDIPQNELPHFENNA